MEYLSLRLQKMRTRASGGTADYAFVTEHGERPFNGLLGRTLALQFEGVIECTGCGRVTRRSYSQGHCWPCAQRLPECDLCIVSPDRCHFDAGSCRDPLWARDHCHQDHVVYLANTSALKVGITRAGQEPTRWLDQGAAQALPILRTRTRQQAGVAEAALRAWVADRTDWRRLLKGEAAPIDLASERERLFGLAQHALGEMRARFGADALSEVGDVPEWRTAYPVTAWPSTMTALSLDRTPRVAGTLLGIKGQYLVFDTGVFNVRKHTGYRVSLSW